MAELAYRREIDGLRSLAVLPVMAFHAGFSAFGGGYIGVDVFFVISGFLITGIIARELDSGTFSLARFYERRARRILPALLAVCLATAIAAWLLMLPQQMEDFAESLASVAVFLSNVLFWRQDGYFTTDSELKPLLHTWSLAVEEQYYILFPPLMMLAWKWGGRGVLALLAGLALASLLWSEWASHHAAMANFYLLPSRAWEILAGACCALLLREVRGPSHWLARLRDRAGGVLALAGLGLILASIFLFTPETRTPSLIALVPVGGTCLVLLFAGAGNLAGRVLGAAPLVGVGLVSYSAYLWHQPLLVFYRLKVSEPTTLGLLAMLALTLLLAWASYRWIEAPMRFGFLKGRGPRPYLVVSAAALVATLVAGLVLRFVPPPISPVAVPLAYHGYGGEGVGWSYDSGPRKGGDGMILFGDSHARHYFGALDAEARAEGRRLAFVGEYGCISLPGVTSRYRGGVRPACAELLGRLRDRLRQDQEATLVWSQFWGQEVAGSNGAMIGKGPVGKDPVASAAVLAGVARLLDEVGPDRQVVLIGAVPGLEAGGRTMEQGLYRCLQYVDVSCPRALPREGMAMAGWNARLRALAAGRPNVQFIDPFDALCDARVCRAEQDGTALYWDAQHLTTPGAREVLFPLFAVAPDGAGPIPPAR
jgi:peptidoglycan/LPS O-acetylase OafA/YrhL